ncbi:pyridoxamine 5'-phosphate oxidase family protein [Actinopolymorpha pittospori]|uniref:General stress protein 26 n=1 Tax=Actinopolymorpha pittospori TaxID=648752 RepID=A0A927RAE0_9ACTN|nr:pyridoxamine 5'-phosphate oxidase family protein [Actinopolymorpha pittospori]MBE1607504.1 general stress protein 26 [Actinopolymorpha pittospori]
MNDLATTAPAFVEKAHTIVWGTLATVDRQGRPRTRVVHPMWEWDGTKLVGWIATMLTPVKRAHLDRTPFASLTYFTADSRDDCSAECRAELLSDDASCEETWERFKATPEPVGYDPAIIPMWADGPTSPGFGVIRLEPWRLRILDGIFAITGGEQGRLLTWQEEPARAISSDS